MSNKKNWIQAMHMKKGALTKTAKAAGKLNDDGTIDKEWLDKQSEKSTKTGRRARLAQTLKSFKESNNVINAWNNIDLLNESIGTVIGATGMALGAGSLAAKYLSKKFDKNKMLKLQNELKNCKDISCKKEIQNQIDELIHKRNADLTKSNEPEYEITMSTNDNKRVNEVSNLLRIEFIGTARTEPSFHYTDRLPESKINLVKQLMKKHNIKDVSIHKAED